MEHLMLRYEICKYYARSKILEVVVVDTEVKKKWGGIRDKTDIRQTISSEVVC